MPDAPNLANLAISQTGFVFDPRSGATYSLNSTAMTVVSGLREGATLAELVARLESSCQAVGERTEADVVDFVQALRREGLVPSDFKI